MAGADAAIITFANIFMATQLQTYNITVEYWFRGSNCDQMENIVYDVLEELLGHYCLYDMHDILVECFLDLQRRQKSLAKNKEIRQNLTRPENFNITSCLIFDH